MKTVFRVGDIVTIREGALPVERIGYALHKDYLDGIEDDKPLAKWAAAAPVINGYDTRQRLTDLVNRMYVDRKGFGGRKRKVIFGSWEYAEMVCGQYRVIGKRVARTGTYHPSSSSGVYDPYFEPAYLNVTGTHVVLRLEFQQAPGFNSRFLPRSIEVLASDCILHRAGGS